MKTLELKSVKQTINKLPLDLINRLLVACDKDCDLFSNNDADSPGKELSPNLEQLIQYLVDSPAKELNAKRKKLIKYITDSNDANTFNKAKALAGSLAVHDEEIQTIKGEIKPLQDELKVKKAQLKKLNEAKDSFIEAKVNELDKTLDNAAKNKLVQYNAVVEKAAVKSQNEKQMKKTLKEVGKGLIASDISGVTEEFAKAMSETAKVTLSFVEEICTQIKEHKETGLDLNTVAGINTINQKFDRKWSTHETNIINQTGLNPDWKKAEAVTCQFEEVLEPKLLMPAKGETVAIAA